MSYFALSRPRVFGHRGAAGVAPENTLPSFALATALGADYLELDVHATRDGSVVVLHDPLLERTTDGSAEVSAHTWSEVRQLDAGYHFTFDGRHFPYRGQGVSIPLLETVLQAFPAQRFNIEIKQGEPDIVESVIEILERCVAVDRTLLAAEHDEIMQRIRTAAGKRIATGMSAAEVTDFVGRLSRGDWDGYRPPGDALQVPPAYAGIEIVSAAAVAAAHRFGCEVHVWTINDRAEIDRLLDLGVDGVMSDLPGLVRTAVAQRKAK
jgi:glycerophosphoryl diester phosphodiesterase